MIGEIAIVMCKKKFWNLLKIISRQFAEDSTRLLCIATASFGCDVKQTWIESLHGNYIVLQLIAVRWSYQQRVGWDLNQIWIAIDERYVEWVTYGTDNAHYEYGRVILNDCQIVCVHNWIYILCWCACNDCRNQSF